MADHSAPAANPPQSDITPAVSVVVPVLNEEENVAPLAAEIAAALEGERFEIVYVDDGSTDGTWARLETLAAGEPRLRAVRHARRAGQSAAVVTGVRLASASIIVTIDGDGQNDPADIHKLLVRYRGHQGDAPLLVNGNRARRKDSAWKRLASRVANRVRGALLGDRTPDTGCGLKVFSRAAFLRLPAFDHMHRFLPALMIRAGGEVVSVEVGHRPRAHGRSNYGVFDRLWVGITDLRGVMWLMRRPLHAEIDAETGTRQGRRG